MDVALQGDQVALRVRESVSAQRIVLADESLSPDEIRNLAHEVTATAATQSRERGEMICRQVHDALRSRIQRVDGEVLRLSAHREVLATDVSKLPAVVPPELECDAQRTEADWFDSGVTDDAGRLAERALADCREATG